MNVLINEYGFPISYTAFILPIYIFLQKAFKKQLGKFSWIVALVAFIPLVNIFAIFIARETSGYDNDYFAFVTLMPFLNYVNFWVMAISDLPIDRDRDKYKNDLKKIYKVDLDWNNQRIDIIAALESGNNLDKQWAIDLLRRHERAGVNESTQLLSKYE